MYKRHARLNQPENSLQKMWRYLTFERLMQIINDSALCFSHISEFDDLWEGLLTTKTEEKLFKIEYNKYKNAKTANSSVKHYREHKDLFFVNCWHMNDNESYLMWRVYANKECAIQTNYERLTASFGDDPPEINGCVINYIDYDREDFPIGNVFIPVSYKNLPYKDEKEFRLLYWSVNLPNQNFQDREGGIKIKVNSNMLIESIYINPAGEIHNEKIEELKKAIKNSKLSCEIKHTRIKEKKRV